MYTDRWQSKVVHPMVIWYNWRQWARRIYRRNIRRKSNL